MLPNDSSIHFTIPLEQNISIDKIKSYEKFKTLESLKSIYYGQTINAFILLRININNIDITINKENDIKNIIKNNIIKNNIINVDTHISNHGKIQRMTSRLDLNAEIDTTDLCYSITVNWKDAIFLSPFNFSNNNINEEEMQLQYCDVLYHIKCPPVNEISLYPSETLAFSITSFIDNNPIDSEESDFDLTTEDKNNKNKNNNYNNNNNNILIPFEPSSNGNLFTGLCMDPNLKNISPYLSSRVILTEQSFSDLKHISSRRGSQPTLNISYFSQILAPFIIKETTPMICIPNLILSKGLLKGVLELDVLGSENSSFQLLDITLCIGTDIKLKLNFNLDYNLHHGDIILIPYTCSNIDLLLLNSLSTEPSLMYFKIDTLFLENISQNLNSIQSFNISLTLATSISSIIQDPKTSLFVVPSKGITENFENLNMLDAVNSKKISTAEVSVNLSGPAKVKLGSTFKYKAIIINTSERTKKMTLIVAGSTSKKALKLIKGDISNFKGKVICLDNDIKITSLAQNACSEVYLRFLALERGLSYITGIKLAELSNGEFLSGDYALPIYIY